VNFSFPTGNGTTSHNVTFPDSASQPASCVQTAAPTVPFPSPILPAPPLPAGAEPPGWAGSCTFNTAGTYSFVCGVHPDMTGTVTVKAPAVPTPTPTATASPAATATATATAEAPKMVDTAAAVEAHDTSSSDTWFQDAAASDRADNQVTVAPGDSVKFSFPAGNGTQSHNVNFKTGPKPAACQQTKTGALPIVAAPAMPFGPDSVGWEGYCTFSASGTYTFVCDAHKNMTGTVQVGAAQPVTPAATPAAVVRDQNRAANPKAWAALQSPLRTLSSVSALAAGKLRLTADCALPSPGKLTLSVSKKLAKALRLKSRTLASANGRCDGNNRFSVTLKPSAAVKRALKRYRKDLTATATVTLAGAKKVTDTRTIKLAGKGS